ncbi:MAG: glycerophosphoryl diester phosphodiesterase membrane domain-containing protein [Coriobacteriia bacterium]|nr:glycerophosphoryl diester phosphodiesterase membrane domain-containing protein [Coriobacteriia bacterium]
MSAKQPNVFASAFRLITRNARCFLAFEVLYKAFGALVMIPLIHLATHACMLACGIEYIGQDNLMQLITCPVTWLVALVMVGVMGLYAMVDISACISIFELSRQNLQAGLLQITKQAFLEAVRVLRPRNAPLIVIVLLIIPFTNFVMVPSFVGSIEIPEFIATFLAYNVATMVLFAVVMLFLYVCAALNMYALHYYVLEDSPFREACRKSRTLDLRHRLRDVLLFLVMQVIGMVLTVVALALVAVLVLFLGMLFQASGTVAKVVEVVASAGAVVVFFVLVVALTTCQVPLCYALLSTLFYRRYEQCAVLDADPVLHAQAVKSPRRARVATVAGVAAAYAVAVLFVLGFYTGAFAGLSVASVEPSVVAHRCGALSAPENTVPALRQAAEDGADWCEIDAQKCADGQIVVMHDSDLKRVAGLDKGVWEVTYDEIKQFDVSGQFTQFKGTRIPLLRDMIRAAKKANMKLQIEIKPSGYDEGIEQDVVDVVRAEGFQQDCVVASMSLDCLKKIRAAGGSDIRTLYIMSIAYGNVSAIEAADEFSVESTWARRPLADTIHANGQFLSAWTVSSPELMETMLERGADRLVTDDPKTARMVVDEYQTGESSPLSLLNVFTLSD